MAEIYGGSPSALLHHTHLSCMGREDDAFISASYQTLDTGINELFSIKQLPVHTTQPLTTRFVVCPTIF